MTKQKSGSAKDNWRAERVRAKNEAQVKAWKEKRQRDIEKAVKADQLRLNL